jgi:hypothetical protein
MITQPDFWAVPIPLTSWFGRPFEDAVIRTEKGSPEELDFDARMPQNINQSLAQQFTWLPNAGDDPIEP